MGMVDKTEGVQIVKTKPSFPMSKYLRVVLTSRCNYACFFCHGEGETVKDLDLDERKLFDVVEANPKLDKIRITGGEPLLRRDLTEIVAHLKEVSDAEVVLTTNAYYLDRCVEGLKEAGLDRLNVSLHSLDRDRYEEITGVNGLDKVLSGLEEAKRYYDDIKVNFVVGKRNLDELMDLVDYCVDNKFVLRLLHIIPRDDGMVDEVLDKDRLYDYVRQFADYTYETKGIRGLFVKGTKVEIKKEYMFPECNVCDKKKYCGEGIYATRLGVDGTLRQCLYKEVVSYDDDRD